MSRKTPYHPFILKTPWLTTINDDLQSFVVTKYVFIFLDTSLILKFVFKDEDTVQIVESPKIQTLENISITNNRFLHVFSPPHLHHYSIDNIQKRVNYLSTQELFDNPVKSISSQFFINETLFVCYTDGRNLNHLLVVTFTPSFEDILEKRLVPLLNLKGIGLGCPDGYPGLSTPSTLSSSSSSSTTTKTISSKEEETPRSRTTSSKSTSSEKSSYVYLTTPHEVYKIDPEQKKVIKILGLKDMIYGVCYRKYRVGLLVRKKILIYHTKTRKMKQIPLRYGFRIPRKCFFWEDYVFVMTEREELHSNENGDGFDEDEELHHQGSGIIQHGEEDSLVCSYHLRDDHVGFKLKFRKDRLLLHENGFFVRKKVRIDHTSDPTSTSLNIHAFQSSSLERKLSILMQKREFGYCLRLLEENGGPGMYEEELIETIKQYGSYLYKQQKYRQCVKIFLYRPSLPSKIKVPPPAPPLQSSQQRKPTLRPSPSSSSSLPSTTSSLKLRRKTVYEYAKGDLIVKPSYVIKHFSSVSNKSILILYLIELHRIGLASPDNTRILLSLFIKQIQRCRMTISQLKERFLDASLESYHQRVVIDMLSLHHFKKLAIREAYKPPQQPDYIINLELTAFPPLDDHHENVRRKNYERALIYLEQLPFSQVRTYARKYGKLFIKHIPKKFTNLLIRLCTGTFYSVTISEKDRNVYPYDEKFHVRRKNPKANELTSQRKISREIRKYGFSILKKYHSPHEPSKSSSTTKLTEEEEEEDEGEDDEEDDGFEDEDRELLHLFEQAFDTKRGGGDKRGSMKSSNSSVVEKARLEEYLHLYLGNDKKKKYWLYVLLECILFFEHGHPRISKLARRRRLRKRRRRRARRGAEDQDGDVVVVEEEEEEEEDDDNVRDILDDEYFVSPTAELEKNIIEMKKDKTKDQKEYFTMLLELYLYFKNELKNNDMDHEHTDYRNPFLDTSSKKNESRETTGKVRKVSPRSIIRKVNRKKKKSEEEEEQQQQQQQQQQEEDYDRLRKDEPLIELREDITSMQQKLNDRLDDAKYDIFPPHKFFGCSNFRKKIFHILRLRHEVENKKRHSSSNFGNKINNNNNNNNNNNENSGKPSSSSSLSPERLQEIQSDMYESVFDIYKVFSSIYLIYPHEQEIMVYFCKQLRNFPMLLDTLKREKKYDELMKATEKYCVDNNTDIWVSHLHYFSKEWRRMKKKKSKILQRSELGSMEYEIFDDKISRLDKTEESIKKHILSILSKNIITPIQTVSILSRVEDLKVDFVKDYMISYLKDLAKSTMELNKKCAILSQECEKVKTLNDVSSKEFKIFDFSHGGGKCSLCKERIDFDYYCYMCGHVFHERCLENGLDECQICNHKNKKCVSTFNQFKKKSRDDDLMQGEMFHRMMSWNTFSTFMGTGMFEKFDRVHNTYLEKEKFVDQKTRKTMEEDGIGDISDDDEEEVILFHHRQYNTNK